MPSEDHEKVQKQESEPKVKKQVTYEVKSLVRNAPLVFNNKDYTRGIYLPTFGSTVIVNEHEIGDELREAEKRNRIAITKQK